MNSYQEFFHFRIQSRHTLFCSTLFGVLLICSCDSSDDSHVLEPEEPIPVESVEEIETDTSLYRMSVREWKEASEAEQTANCAGIIRSSMDSIEISDSEKFNDLAEELCSCMRQLTHGMPTMNNNRIFNEAKRCLATMGYREESDSLSLN